MACKPDSVGAQAPTTIHLGAALPMRSCCQPGPPGQSCPCEVPIWHCSRWGLPCRSGCPNRGGLLPHRFTLTPVSGRSVLCGAFRRVSPPGRYPAPLLCGVRTFLERFRPRPSGHPRGTLPRRLIPLGQRRSAWRDHLRVQHPSHPPGRLPTVGNAGETRRGAPARPRRDSQFG